MKSVLSIAAGALLGALVAIPSVSAQANGLPDDSPGSGAIIDPHQGVGQPGDPLRNDPGSDILRDQPIDPRSGRDGLADDPLFGRSEPGLEDDRLDDDLDPRTDEEGVAGDAPLRDDDLDTFDDGLDDEPGLDEPETLPGDDGLDSGMDGGMQ